MKVRKTILIILSVLAIFLLSAAIRLYHETPGDTDLGFFPIAFALLIIGIVRVVLSRKFKNSRLYMLQDFLNIVLVMFSIFIHGHHEQEMLQGQILTSIGLLMTIGWGIFSLVKFN